MQLTNKTLLQGWVDDCGEDSDFARVRVRGVFPRASSLRFIPRDLVDEAMKRKPNVERFTGRTAAVGVDVARFGSLHSVIRTRIGRDGASIPPKRFRGLDTVQLANKVAEHIGYLLRCEVATTPALTSLRYRLRRYALHPHASRLHRLWQRLTHNSRKKSKR